MFQGNVILSYYWDSNIGYYNPQNVIKIVTVIFKKNEILRKTKLFISFLT